MQYINPSEAIKRLAAAQGIDVLNLVKTDQQIAEETQQAQQAQQQQAMLDQAGQLANSPLMDPQKNPGMMANVTGEANADPAQPPMEDETEPPIEQ